MAQHMLMIPPTEPQTSWTKLMNLVAPVLAMDVWLSDSSDEDCAKIQTWLASRCGEWTAIGMDSQNSYEVWTEADGPQVGAKRKSTPQSRSPSECIELGKSRRRDEACAEVESCLASQCGERRAVRVDSPNSHEVWTEADGPQVGEKRKLIPQNRSQCGERRAVRVDSPNSHEVWTEADGPPVGAKRNTTPQSRSPSECMELEKSRVLSTKLTKGLMETVSEYVREHPGKRLKFVFEFSAEQSHKDFEEKTNTLKTKFSCNAPEGNMKPLTEAIRDVFWPHLDQVKITVDGNELEMLYNSKRLFKSELKDAEFYIEHAVKTGRYRWLRFVQTKLIDRYVSDKSTRGKEVCGKKLQYDLGLPRCAAADAKGCFREPFTFYGPDLKRAACCLSPKDSAFPIQWGRKWTGEVIRMWLEGIVKRRGCLSNGTPIPFFRLAFKCSSSSAEDIETPGIPPVTSVFASNLKDYICSHLRMGAKPPVIIRVTNMINDSFLTGPPKHNTSIIQSTGEAEGYRISVSDADGRRVLLCRSSNFYTAFREFLAPTDIDKSTDLEGSEQRRVGSGDSNAPPTPTEDCERKPPIWTTTTWLDWMHDAP